MKLGLSVMMGVILLAACSQSIQGRCAAKHGTDGAAYERCVTQAEARLLTGPGSAFQKGQRGGR